jgi:hypothetical protein
MTEEQSRRLDCFDERHCAPVVLADGQTWFLPKPWLEIRPTFRGGRAESAYPVLTYGPELDALVEAIGNCEDITNTVSAVASLAAYLLQRHYRLTDPDLDRLLCLRVDDESSGDWIGRVIEVATGRSGPKVSSAGGG